MLGFSGQHSILHSLLWYAMWNPVFLKKYLLNFHMWTLYSFSKSLKKVKLNSSHFKLITKFYLKMNTKYQIWTPGTPHNHIYGSGQTVRILARITVLIPCNLYNWQKWFFHIHKLLWVSVNQIIFFSFTNCF